MHEGVMSDISLLWAHKFAFLSSAQCISAQTRSNNLSSRSITGLDIPLLRCCKICCLMRLYYFFLCGAIVFYFISKLMIGGKSPGQMGWPGLDFYAYRICCSSLLKSLFLLWKWKWDLWGKMSGMCRHTNKGFKHRKIQWIESSNIITGT